MNKLFTALSIALAILLAIPVFAQTSPLPIQGSIALTSGAPNFIINTQSLNSCKYWFTGTLTNTVSFYRGNVTPPTTPATSTSGVQTTNTASVLYTFNLASTKYFEISQAGGGATLNYFCTASVPDDVGIHLAGPSPTPLPVNLVLPNPVGVAVTGTPAPIPFPSAGATPGANWPFNADAPLCYQYASTPTPGSGSIWPFPCGPGAAPYFNIYPGSSVTLSGTGCFICATAQTIAPVTSSTGTSCTPISTTAGWLTSVNNTNVATQTATITFYNDNASCTAANALYSITLAPQQIASWPTGIYFGTAISYQLSGSALSNISIGVSK